MSYISQRHQDNFLPAELRAEGQLSCPTMPRCPQELWPDVDKSEATKASGSFQSLQLHWQVLDPSQPPASIKWS